MKGDEIYAFAKKIYPIFRSLTGKGVEETLEIIAKEISNTNTALSIKRIPSGTRVFDWTVPKEWSISKAYIENEMGEHIADIAENNLHVVGYSVPVDRWVTKDELLQYIYVQEGQPDVIPYVTSYYKERYGFCMSQNQRDSLPDGRYHMVVESELFDGNLTYGEVVIPGATAEEMFFSTYICHPSMANNECSGPALATELIKYVANLPKKRYTYRFLFIPETIGSIAYMATEGHLAHMKSSIVAGYNLTCVGDAYDYSIVHTRYADTLADRVLMNILRWRNHFSEYSFLQRGSDERQYNAPGIDLPIVTFCRTKFHEFPQYHTSADNMEYISPIGLQGSYDVMTECINAIEHNHYYKTKCLGEPQLGPRGLYPTISQKGNANAVKSMMDFLAYADGRNDLIDISNRIERPITELLLIISKLVNAELIEQIN